MKITDALEATGKAVKGFIYGKRFAYIGPGGVLIWSDTEGPVEFDLMFGDNWTTYHPTPEKCGCEACKLKERMQTAVKKYRKEYDTSDAAIACNDVMEFLLSQACKREKP